MAYLPTFDKINGALNPEDEQNKLERAGDVGGGTGVGGVPGAAPAKPSLAQPAMQAPEMKSATKGIAQAKMATLDPPVKGGLQSQLPNVIAQQQPVAPQAPAPAQAPAAPVQRPGVVMLGGGTPTMSIYNQQPGVSRDMSIGTPAFFEKLMKMRGNK